MAGRRRRQVVRPARAAADARDLATRGIAVGLVISGEYFGWSYGWASAGTLGFVVTALFVAAMYTTFIFSFTELTTSIPHAGGPFAYARRAFGPTGGYLAGAATLVEFVFAPPAIALAIGAYLHVQFPASVKHAAMGAYLVFMALNIVGVQIAATFELVVTLLAIFELLVFMGVVSPGFAWSNFMKGGWSGADHFSVGAFHGMFAAILFAIWFFLAIEGVAMAAEEAKNPEALDPDRVRGRDPDPRCTGDRRDGVRRRRGRLDQAREHHDPLPQAMKYIVGANSGWMHMLVARVVRAGCVVPRDHPRLFAPDSRWREGYLPEWLGKVHPRFKTPHRAILAGGVVGIAAIYSDELIQFGGQTLTANIVTMSVFGAIVMYIVSMASLFAAPLAAEHGAAVPRAAVPDLPGVRDPTRSSVSVRWCTSTGWSRWCSSASSRSATRTSSRRVRSVRAPGDVLLEE